MLLLDWLRPLKNRCRFGSHISSRRRSYFSGRRAKKEFGHAAELLEDRTLLSLIVGSSDESHRLDLCFSIDEYGIFETQSGEHSIQVAGMSDSGQGGNPQLPSSVLRVALPPDTDLETVVLEMHSETVTPLMGDFNIPPAPLAAAEVDGQVIYDAASDQIVDGKNSLVYSCDEYYDTETCTLLATQQMGRWKLAEILCSPFAYNPVSQDLYVTETVSFSLTYQDGDSLSADLASLTTSDACASEIVANYDQACAWYLSEMASGDPAANDTDGYVIVTTSDIQSGSTQLDDFVSHKQNLGYDVQVVTEATWGGGTGDTAAENIRSWLQSNYVALGIDYVLLVGDPDPTSGDVPMKMMYPRNSQDSDKEAPSDYYYADLTSDWDSDNDGYYGEWNDDFSTQPLAEVIVGRIPVYGASYTSLDSILAKTTSYETESVIDWRENILLPMAISNYANEDGEGASKVDGESLAAYITSDIATPNSYDTYTLYEKAGLDPVPETPDAPLTKTNLLNEWSTNAYGVTAWWGHGSQMGAYRKYWATDDGDSVPESAEMTQTTFMSSSDVSSLDDSHPSVVVQVSCNNGTPENSSNLGYSLLTNGAIATYSGSRVTWYAAADWQPSFGLSAGDNASYAYYITDRLVDNPTTETTGAALQWCRENFGMGWSSGASWMNALDFNLYGDPTIRLGAGGAVSGIDLFGTEFGVDESGLAAAAGQVNVDFKVTNGGDTAAEAFDVQFYLSDDSDIDPTTDILLQVSSTDPSYDSAEPEAYHVAGLASLGTCTGSVALDVPLTDPFGTDNEYFIGMFVDADGDVTEVDETNNRNKGQGSDLTDASYSLLKEDFTGGLPATWTVVDGGNSEDSWTDTNPRSRNDANWDGTFMIVDSDNAGSVAMDEQLITSSINCSGYEDITLDFTHYFHSYSGNEIGDVDVSVNGGAWQNVQRYQGTDAKGSVSIDLSSYADNQSDVRIRWHYYDANYDWYWGIDNIEVTGVQLAGINVTPTSGLTTTEADGTDTFTITLQSEPSAAVTIPLSSSDETEGTVPTSVTIQPAEWNTGVQVTVTGVDDLLDDGNVGYTIVTGAAISTDGRYNGIDPSDVSARNQDNDPSSLPDLTAWIDATNEPYEWGQQVVFDFRVENVGTAESDPCTATVYMSTNSTITTEDYALVSYSVPAKIPGGIWVPSGTATLPATPPAGFTDEDTVYFGLYIDSGNVVPESNEDNNTDYDSVPVTTPSPTTQVTVTAEDSNAGEPSNDGTYRITRTGSTTSSLTVNFLAMSGTATPGSDYVLKQDATTLTATSVVIPAGQSSVDVTLNVTDDTLGEGTESAIFTLTTGAGYSVGTPSTATISIGDDDPFIVWNTLDSGSGSFRQAILDANDRTGTDQIHFAIPGDGPHTIALLSPLPVIEDSVVIDGYTQQYASPNTNPVGAGLNTVLMIELDGSNAGANADGLSIRAGNSTIRGLAINRFDDDGIVLRTNGSNRVEGCFIGTDVLGSTQLSNFGDGINIYGGSSDNTIGGLDAASRNLISGNSGDGVQIWGTEIPSGETTGNKVLGNLIGTNITGTQALANTCNGVLVASGASDNWIGGTAIGSCNVISGNTSNGIEINDNGTTGNIVAGNFIGTDRTGTVAIENENNGVLLYDGASGNTIGGTEAGARNVISGNKSDGIEINGSETAGNVVLGNFIGTDSAGIESLANARRGVLFYNGPSNNSVGGTEAGAHNVIAYNGMEGVYVSADGGSGNSIRGNSIFGNSDLGIDLGVDDPNVPTNGVTANDSGDVDDGANGLQNFPILSSALTSGASVEIDGVLHSAGNTQFTIDFYSNTPPSSLNDFSEGETWIGSTDVTTDAAGDKAFDVSFNVSVPAGRFVSATATGPNGSTSEFSTGIRVADNGRPWLPQEDGITVGQSLSFRVSSDAIHDGTLVATDPDGDALTYSIASQPAHGTITLNASTGAFTYRPQTDYAGADTFLYTANDGQVSSKAGLVSIVVTPADSETILHATFDDDNGGFSYVDDAFDTSQPVYADGVWDSVNGLVGGVLQVSLGGIDNQQIADMSGGWQRTFTLTEPTEVSGSFWVKVTQSPHYEATEFTEALLSLDGTTQEGFVDDGYVPGQSYFGRNGYIEYIAGDCPIILSAPHGGAETPDEIPDRTWGTTVTDRNTKELAVALRDQVYSLTGHYPHVIICNLKRTKLDANRDIDEAAQGNQWAEQAWYEYHDFIEHAKAAVVDRYGTGNYIDLHGHGDDHPDWLELGYLLSASELTKIDAEIGLFKNESSIRTLADFTDASFAELLRGDSSFGGLMEAQGYDVVPSPTDPNPGDNSYFSAGYNTDRHGSDDGGPISGFQLEAHYTGFRDTDENRQAAARAMAESLDVYLETHYGVTVDASADHLAQVAGNGDCGQQETTGWRLVHVDFGQLEAGSHTLAIGGYNNSKSDIYEHSEILVDNVLLTGRPLGPPTVVSLSPADDSSSVVVDTNLVMTFNENIQKGTGNVVIKKSSDNSVIHTVDVSSQQVTVSDATATVGLTVTLSESTEYYVEVAAGAFQDLSGNDFAGINDATTWSFTTEESIAPTLDFGDAPSPYAVTSSTDGARHVAIGPKLGSNRDAEPDGQPTANADGDDGTGTPDDEDGVTFPSAPRVGQLDASATVNVQNAPSGAKLDAWIDFNGDGSWGGPFEHIADNVSVQNGNNTIEFDIPSWAEAGTTYARFRLSTTGNLGEGGQATDGEVEDYVVTLSQPLPTNGVFSDQKAIGTDADGAYSVFAADVDGDGDNDVLSASFLDDTIAWYENDGQGNFVLHTISTDAGSPRSVFGTDVDGDGDMDVLAARWSGVQVAWYENDGEEHFTQHIISTNADGAYSVFAADVDGDGDTDVLSASVSDDKVAWYENDGNQLFSEHIITVDADRACSVFATDVDGDGDLDAISASQGDNKIAWYENDGSASFTTHPISLDASGAESVFAADVDGDGDTDVLSASHDDDTIAWYENDGNQTFTAHAITTSADSAQSVFAADLDGDGDLDVLSASFLDDTIAWYENDGTEVFALHTISNVADGAYSVFAADVNGDGDLDAITACVHGDMVVWYENQGENHPPVVSTNTGIAVNEGATETIRETELRATDVDTPAQTLTYTILTNVAHGTLYKSGTELTASGTFTQSDIDAGDVSYTHDGSETSSDSFVFSVSDGNGGTIGDTTFAITVTDVDDFDPEFSAADYPATVAEDIADTATIATVSATEGDLTGTVSYAITSGNDSGLFEVHGTTGVVSLASGKSLDAETATSHVLTVTASESDGAATDTATVTITVTDVDEFDPEFSATDYPATVAENIADTVTIATVSATEADLTGTVSYAITSGNDSGLFEIDETTGVVRLASGKSLNAENATSHVLTVTASETDGSGTDTATVTVTVTDVDEFDPEFAESNYSPTVAENIADTVTIATVSATEGDLTGSVTYAITDGNAEGLFTIHETTGVVSLAAGKSLNAETSTSHVLTVTASETDGSGTDTATVTVTVTDVDEFDPEFAESNYSPSVAENIADTVTIATVSATEADLTGSVTYAITDGNAEGLFTIHETTGVVSLAAGKSLNAETSTSHVLTVTASETDGSGTDTATVTVTVTDVDEFDPEFAESNYSPTVAENIADTVTIATVSATEGDLTGSVTYAITDGNAEGLFTIHETTGVVRLASGKSLNAENATSHVLTVTASETDGSGTDTATVTVTVTDVDEFDPEFAESNYSPTVAENIADTVTIATVSATEGDLTGSVTYAITGGNAEGLFTIHETTGVVRLASGKSLNAETSTSHVLTVTASETDGSGTDTATVTVTVTDVDEFDPEFAESNYSPTVAENIADTVTIATVSATEGDLTGSVTYAITDGNAEGLFTIHETTGVVRLASGKSLNAEATTGHVLTVTASESDGSGTDTATVTITVTDVDEFDPEFGAANYPATVAEDIGDTITIATVSATEADLTGTVSYAITSGNAEGLFTIHETTGVVSLAAGKSLNAETSTSHVLTVTASETDGSGTDTATVTVTVTDVDEFDPEFAESNYSPSVAENIADTVTIATVSATEADLTGSVTYAITDGNAEGLFTIHETTGVVRLAAGKSLNAETSTSHVLTVTASETDGSGTDTATVTVTVTDVDEFDPEFAESNYSPTVAENIADTVTIATVSATEEDLTGSVTYAITGGNAEGLFTIHETTGVVSLAAGKSLNAETSTSHVLTVTASETDGSGTDTATVTVTVTDVDEFDPEFAESNYSPTVAENIADTVTIATVSATEEDLTGSVTYAITDGNAEGLFTIHETTGVVRLASGKSLNAETSTSHVLTVTASESDGSGTDTATVTITVTDVDEFDPEFAESNYSPTVAENIADTVTIATVSATEGDLTGSVTYAITDGNAEGLFTIHETTGVVSLASGKSLNAETSTSHVLTVTASETDGSGTDTATVTVTVTDMDEFDPEFAESNYSPTVAENIADTVTIATVSATEGDLTGTVSYAITSGNDAGLFEIEETTGVVSLASGKSLNAESTTSHVLTVTASETDGSGTDTATVTVTVTDVDEFDPEFSDEDYPATVAENIADTVTIATVSATEGDLTGSVTYAITGGNAEGLFTIHETTGVVSLAAGKSLNAETSTSHVLTVTASETDGSGTDTATVTVTVTDVDEFDPEFAESNYSPSVAENIADTVTVATVSATEGDLTGSVTYAITDGNDAGLFEIDGTSGVVSLASGKSLNAESTTSHVLTVTASETDGSGTDTATVTVTVTDVDEFDPEFAESNYSPTVAENIADTVTIATVSATEGDLTGSVTYAITDGNAEGLFTIHETTGVVRLASGKSLNAENATSHVLTVTASETDGSGTDTATVTVTVTDVDEFDPEFAESNYSPTVAENIADTVTIATVSATEGDLTGSVTYAITGGNAEGLFTIHETTGVVRLASGKSLNAETSTSHVLTVTASETDGSGTDTATVTVTVTDVDEFDPEFSDEDYPATVAEDITDTVTIATASATENDLTGTVSYAITDGNAEGLFTIHETTGVVSLASGKSLDAETTTDYQLTVTASESDGLGTDTATVTITVTDVDEFDFGDAPNSIQSGFAGSYRVAAGEDGARHIATGPMLGATRDSESDGVHSADADADDTMGTSDDEDGVTFPTGLLSGQNATVSVTASDAGELSFWIDFDQSGSFDNATERFTHSFSTSGTHDITFAVPATAQLGETYARFRFSTSTVADPHGPASDGEVEDYRVTIRRQRCTIGFYNPDSPGSGAFFLRNSNTAGIADTVFGYGPAGLGWGAVSGDWNGDGGSTVGLYNASLSEFYLKNTHNGGVADVVFGYGPAGSNWVPVAGDWDGDGTDTLGLYNQVTSTFYLENSHSGGVADIVFEYGPAGSNWVPVAGDWDGDGDDTLGFYNQVTSQFYLKNSHSGGMADIVFAYGPAGSNWVPLAGDWDGDGDDTLGLYDSLMSQFYLKNSHSGGVADIVFAYGPVGSGWVPLTGDWTVSSAIQLDVAPLASPVSDASLAESDLAPIVETAIGLWADAGVSANELPRLEDVEITIADLPGSYLALTSARNVVVDVDGAGYGWYTGGLNAEFGIQNPEAAESRVDLLTVVAHELGHVLGLGHDAADDVMEPLLPLGVRRLPGLDEIDAAFASGWDGYLLP